MSLINRWILRSLRQSRWLNYSALVSGRDQNRYYNNRKDEKSKINGLNTGIGVLFASVLIGENADNSSENKPPQTKKTEAGCKRADLPTYSAEEVSKHNSKLDFWVTYKQGVYDVTAFLPSHPGGEQILHAGGLGVEPFWDLYGVHETDEVHGLLETYRIGNLQAEDVPEPAEGDLWAGEPPRDARLLVRTARPFNAEVPPHHLIEHFDTPNELFYVRQHMPVPAIDPASHRLRVEVAGPEGAACREFSLEELAQFRRGTVRAALMCAGNRRSEMATAVKDKEVKGISWGSGAVSCAVWGGVFLRDVLLACGVDEHDTQGKHVILEGCDVDATGAHFSTSIPLGAALSARGGVLLATHMNGRALPPDHGRPLRAVVPGAPAVRSVKWLRSIKVSREESESHWHQKDYRSFNSSATWETADFRAAPPLYSLPVTSACCDPRPGDTAPVTDGCIQARGYAYSGGGAAIVRVDVSADGGGTWTAARLRGDRAPPAEHYAWTLWSATVPVPTDQQEVELWVKATDSNFNTQPETFEHIWNIRGILSNAYQRIKVKLQH